VVVVVVVLVVLEVVVLLVVVLLVIFGKVLVEVTNLVVVFDVSGFFIPHHSLFSIPQEPLSSDETTWVLEEEQHG